MKKIRFISLILAVIFCLSGIALTVFAADEAVDDGDSSSIDVDPGNEDPLSDDPVVDPGYEDPVSDDPVVDPGYEDPVSDDPVVDPGYEDSGNDSGYVDDNYYYYDEDPIYYGDSSNYSYYSDDNNRAAGSVSDYTSLYNSSSLNDSDLASVKWDNITLDEKEIKTGAADFSALQTDVVSEDNGYWILYVGLILIGLSVLGILYFIIATVSAKKKSEKTVRTPVYTDSADTSASDLSAFEDTAESYARVASRHGRYADGYNGGYSSRYSSNADTGEVYTPRRFAKK